MRKTGTLLGIILLWACGSFADDGKPAVKPGAVRPGDLLAIHMNGVIEDVPGDAYVRVGVDGTLPVPFIGPIDVTGKTTAEIEKAVAEGLSQNKIESNPEVVVRRLQVGKFEAGPIRPFDLIRVDVLELDGAGRRTSVVRRVTGDGTFGLPVVGPVKLTGLTDAEAVKAVVEKYENAKVIHAAVSIVTPIERAPAVGGEDLPDLPVGAVDEAMRLLLQPPVPLQRGK